MMKSLLTIAITLSLVACGSDSPHAQQQSNRNKAMLEHNEVSLQMQQAWGSKPRDEQQTQDQRTWEQKMRTDCNPADAQDQIGQDLNVIYCEINAMQERIQTLKR